jgi:hypothetical protein
MSIVAPDRGVTHHRARTDVSPGESIAAGFQAGESDSPQSAVLLAGGRARTLDATP